MSEETWRILCEGGTRDVVVEERGYVGDGRRQYAVSGVYIVDVSARMAVTRWCAMEAHAQPVREILAPGEFSADERVASERARIRAACDAIRDRALDDAEREMRTGVVRQTSLSRHYALACGAIECADAIGYGAK